MERANSAEPEGEFQFRAEAEAGALPVALSNAGYHTAFLGKYLNGYGSGVLGNSPNTRVPPGWSDWRAAVDPYVYRFWSTHLNVNGTVQDLSGEFQADVYAEQAESMIGQASGETSTMPAHWRFIRTRENTGNISTIACNVCSIVGKLPRWP